MFHCAILGDSLAAGVAMFRPGCVVDTQVGITSGRYVAGHIMAVDARTVLISLGVNDGPQLRATAIHLVQLRRGIAGKRVYWILPARPDATRKLVYLIARMYGDRLIDTRGFTGPDGLHLTSFAYRSISRIFDPPVRP